MNTEKLRKISGIILLVKSFLLLVGILIFSFSGIALIIDGQKQIENANNSSEPAVDCSGLGGAISVILGIVFLIVTVMLILFFVVYFINSRKILNANEFPKGSIICMIIFEIIFVVEAISLVIGLIKSDGLFGLILIELIVLIQSAVTTIILFLTLRSNKKLEY